MESVTHRQGTETGNTNVAALEGETDQMGISEGDMAIMGAQARTSSSYNSHSIEQLDSTSRTNQKSLGEAAPAESSTHQEVQTFFLLAHPLNLLASCHSFIHIQSSGFMSLCRISS